MTSQVPESRAESLPALDRIDPYMDWAKAPSVPIVEGYYVEDMAGYCPATGLNEGASP